MLTHTKKRERFQNDHFFASAHFKEFVGQHQTLKSLVFSAL